MRYNEDNQSEIFIYNKEITMPLQLVRNDITRMRVDAIVNAAKKSLLGGGGVDGAIHEAAGPGLLAECKTLGGCETGNAKITGAYRLDAKFVIHTVGPVWHGGQDGEAELLAACYRNSLQLALAHGCESVAFPLISTGVYGYPMDEAVKVATDAIREFLMQHDMMVYLVLFGQRSMLAGQKLYADIQSFIDDVYVDEHLDREFERRLMMAEEILERCSAPVKSNASNVPMPVAMAPATVRAAPAKSLEDMLRQMDESFMQMLFRKIDEKGMTDAACYKKANVDRKLFSKMRNDIHYKPSKLTAVAFAMALEMNIRDAKALLEKAGYALSRASKFDVIIEYCLLNGIYDIFKVNEILFDFDQPLLGA